MLKDFSGNFYLPAYLLIFCQIVSYLNFAFKILLNINPTMLLYIVLERRWYWIQMNTQYNFLR